MQSESAAHRWHFYRSGGFYQVHLDSVADFMHLDQLDQKLWVALSCPSRGLNFDPRTLALLDADQDGYIRANELVVSLKWAIGLLNTPELLLQEADALPLSAINTDTPEGAALKAAAEQILQGLGKHGANSICCADTENSAAALAALPLNGDGVVTPDSTDDPMLRTLIETVLAAYGGKPDRSGKPGIDQVLAAQFFQEGRALLAWRDQGLNNPALSPFGEQTPQALNLLDTLRPKLEDYFARCNLAAFDPRSTDFLSLSEEQLRQLCQQSLSDLRASPLNHPIASLPLSAIAPGKPCPLHPRATSGVNPAWTEVLAAFSVEVVRPVLGDCESLDEAQWQQLLMKLQPCLNWHAAKPATPLGALPDSATADLPALLTPVMEQQLLALIEADLALASAAGAIAQTDRLVRYIRHLAKLARNFVSFQDFYSNTDKALFQAGTLYLDGRSCDLCVQVLDPGKHAALAALSGIYLAYCDCIRGESNQERMTIAAAFTAGDSDQLMVGRNGLFYDRQGRDWHATITRIVDHPISLQQAFWSPYKKLVRLAGEQLQKIAASKAGAAENGLNSTINALGQKVSNAATLPPGTPQKPPAAAHAPFDVARFAGIFAAIGLAVGALGTAVASLLHGFLNLNWWQMPLAITGLMLVISGPSVVLAGFKLRNRNLGPLLDANGWAINTRARINIPFGRSLTQLAKLPAGVHLTNQDPYAEKKTPWLRYFVLGGMVAGAALLFKFIKL